MRAAGRRTPWGRSRQKPVLPSRPLRVREHARSASATPRARGGPDSRAGARPGALDAAPIRHPSPRVDGERGDPDRLGGPRRLGADAAQLRRLRLARLGLPDAAPEPGPWTRALLETAHLP